MSGRRAFFRELGAVAREARRATEPARREPEPAAEPEEVVLPRRDDDRPAEELERYSRQLVMPEWSEAAQLALRDASVLVVGAGALGSPVATYLAGAGVGRIGLVDDDDVELSNLARQFAALHARPRRAQGRERGGQAALPQPRRGDRALPRARSTPTNAEGLLAGHDLVVDCSDSFATRYAVNAACCAAGVAAGRGRRARAGAGS